MRNKRSELSIGRGPDRATGPGIRRGHVQQRPDTARRAGAVHRAATQAASPLTVLLLALFLCLPVQANVVTVGDARFPTYMQTSDGQILELKGTGLARYAVFVRVYGAGLYGPEGVDASQILERGDPKRLEIEYFVDIDAADLARAANTILERQLSPEQLRDLEPRIREMHDAYSSVRPGDRYVMEYQPGQGTRLILNDQTLVTVEGADFARAYFGIWLGEEPLSRPLRNALLGTTAGR